MTLEPGSCVGHDASSVEDVWQRVASRCGLPDHRGWVMQIEEHVVGEVTVLTLSGRMTRNDHYGALTKQVHDLVHAGRRTLVLDLGAVSYMDSMCLGEIIRGLVPMRKRGGALHLANLPERVKQLMTLVGLTSVFQVFESASDAVHSLAAGMSEH
jgi:anti-sigma B factor antagonist